MTRPRLIAAAIAAALALGSGSAGLAAWSGSGGGSAASRALTMPVGQAPTAGANGTSVTVRWPTATFSTGAGVEGYVVHRYDTLNGAPATVGAGCNGVVTSTTCTETGVAVGTWVYTVVPAQGAWRGGESPVSNAVTTG